MAEEIVGIRRGLGVSAVILVAMLLFFPPAGRDGAESSPEHNVTPTSTDAAVSAGLIVAGASEGPRPQHGIPTFTDVASASGIISSGGSFFAWGDYDNDRDEDFLVDGGRLYRNDGPPLFGFTDVTAAAGITGGGTGNWADFDNDGFLDFYQTGTSRLWRNDGDGTFTDVTVSAGNPTTTDPTTAVAWADYDRDGDVDLFLAGAEGSFGVYYRDHLFRNNGDGTFTDVTVSMMGSAENNSPKYGRGATWADYNDDGWLDLYVTNYRQQPNYLYRNDAGTSFTDVAPSLGLHDPPPDATNNPDPCNRAGHGVGSSWADYDNDGVLDLVVGTFNHKDWRTSDDTQLWHGNGPGAGYTFTNVRATAGIPVKPYDLRSPPHPYCGSSDGSIWTGPQGDELIVGATWGDVDNDGYLDLWMPQIYDISYAYSYLYKNNGGTFTDIAQASGVRVWDTYGGAFSDYDQDGDLDLVTGGRDAGGVGAPSSIHLFRNDGVAGHAWMAVRLEGCGIANSAMIGARLRLTAGMATYMRNVEAGQNSHSQQNSMVQHFGLGHYAGPTADLSVRTPGGQTLNLPGLAVNRTHAIRVDCPDPVQDAVATLTGAGLADVTLTWTPPADTSSVTGYAIYGSFSYSPTGGSYRFLGFVPKGTDTFTQPGVGKGDVNNRFYQILTNSTGASVVYGKQLAKYTLNMLRGHVLFSVPILPFDPTPGAVFTSIAGQYEVVRTFNASDPADPWTIHHPSGPAGDLAAVLPGMGVWASVTAPSFASFAVTGVVQETTTVTLKAGWNLIGYASFTPRTVATALAGIPWTRVQGFSWSATPYYLVPLTASDTLSPGDGFWIYVTADATWTVTS